MKLTILSLFLTLGMFAQMTNVKAEDINNSGASATNKSSSSTDATDLTNAGDPKDPRQPSTTQQ